ncbi:sialic acid-specific 9-O-acetylesterase [Bifidobacterium cuniculi]|uniref:Sialic acid-specific 9-O-acetylesterase n=2 Tax=Bifidobacterium cuniculi TaxID=1688 RepID=A0A087B3D0_9BIFI|nr:sialic acid-specific 9-O-acetylesterase [Bifidobacterium cuniculi]
MAIVTGIAPGASGVVESIRQSHSRHDRHDRTVSGSLRVAAVFSDRMVLQRDRPIAVFGTGTPDAKVVVSLSDDHGTVVAESATRVADSSYWTAALPALPAGGPYQLNVSCETDSLVFRDVLLGEVWFAGGQSNMELEVHTSADGDAAIAAADDPLLRFINIPKVGQVDRAAEAAATWQPAMAPQVGGMSAVAYYFGRRLRERLGVPVGIIDCYIGGTSITCWMGRGTLETSDAARPYLEEYDRAIAGKSMEQMRKEKDGWQRTFDKWNADVEKTKRKHPGISQPEIDRILGPCPWPPPVTPFSERRVCAPYEGMVERVAPYTVAGFLWYQGEEDEARADGYGELLRLLIDSWRALWDLDGYGLPSVGYQPVENAGRAPFLVVQLPQWIDGRMADDDPRHWPVIRAAQYEVSRELDDVSLICTMDCGEFDNIHPLDKQTVGDRLADLALHDVYGDDTAAADSPEAADVRFEGHEVLVTFAHADGLHWKGTTPDTQATAKPCEDCEIELRMQGTSGFEVADDDGVWSDANAQIMDDGTVRVWADAVREPRHVRYAWRSWGPAPLFNREGLPTFPFMR